MWGTMANRKQANGQQIERNPQVRQCVCNVFFQKEIVFSFSEMNVDKPQMQNNR